MMLRGLWKLTGSKIKIFLREPLAIPGTIFFPVPSWFSPALSQVPQAKN